MLMQRCWQSSPGSIRHSSWSSPGRLLGSSASVPSDRASRLAISISETLRGAASGSGGRRTSGTMRGSSPSQQESMTWLQG